jgi:predicted Zn-dependent protease
MKSDKATLAMGLAGVLILAGCGKTQPDSQVPVEATPGPAASDAEQPALARDMPPADVPTNDAPSGAAEFARNSLASPFVSADQGLRETYDRALIALQIGDYSRAFSELQALADAPDLSPQQKQAVHDLLAKTLKLAPELAKTNAPSAGTVPPEFPLVGTQPGESPQNLTENPFTTADPAVQRTFGRAKAAYELGNYAEALVELKLLASHPQLNWQQKYAVQLLLDKTPHNNPAVPATPSKK